MEIILTVFAAAKVKEFMAAEKLEDDAALRVRISGGGCSGFQYDLYFDKSGPDDLLFDCHDVKVIVDKMSILYLGGTTIDYVDGLQGAGFKFDNPTTKSTCGCGQSFAV